MVVKVKEQIKSLIAFRAITIKKLAEMLTKETGKKYTPNSLSKRLSAGSITYNEVTVIAELLNYRIHFEDMEEV